MQDLDRLIPPVQRIRLGGVEYDITTRDGLPLAAVIEGQRFAADADAQRDPEKIAAFLARITPIPLDVLRSLRIVQFNALMRAIFPPEDAAAQGGASEDPPRLRGPISA